MLYSVDEDLKYIEKLTDKNIFYSIDERGSHKIEIDLSDYNIEIIQGKYVVVHIKRFSGNLVIKTAPSDKNPSAIRVFGVYKKDSLSYKKIKFSKWGDYVTKLRVQLEKI